MKGQLMFCAPCEGKKIYIMSSRGSHVTKNVNIYSEIKALETHGGKCCEKYILSNEQRGSQQELLYIGWPEFNL